MQLTGINYPKLRGIKPPEIKLTHLHMLQMGFFIFLVCFFLKETATCCRQVGIMKDCNGPAWHSALSGLPLSIYVMWSFDEAWNFHQDQGFTD